MIFFKSGWARYEEARKGTLRLAPSSARMDGLLDDYKNMKSMFFSRRPDFIEIVKVLTEWETAFNQGVSSSPSGAH